MVQMHCRAAAVLNLLQSTYSLLSLSLRHASPARSLCPGSARLQRGHQLLLSEQPRGVATVHRPRVQVSQQVSRLHAVQLQPKLRARPRAPTQ